MSSWITLVVAGLFEVGWAFGLKASEGFTRPIPSILTIVCLVLSFWLLTVSLRALPVGTAYAVWTGIGAIGTALAGMAFLGESRDAPRLVCLVLIAAGIVGLKLFAPAE